MGLLMYFVKNTASIDNSISVGNNANESIQHAVFAF